MSKGLFFILLTLLLLLISFYAGLQQGSFITDTRTLWQALLHYNAHNPTHMAIVELRMPRLLLAFGVGASLAFCGYLMQLLVNNALADPYILGSAAGAALGANIAYFGLLPLTILGLYTPPFAAFVCCLLVTLLVVALGYSKGQLIPAQLLLAGIAITALIGAIISLLTFLSDSEGKLRSIVFWSMGGFERADWGTLPYVLVPTGLCLLLFVFLQKQLNLLLLGDARAATLGANVQLLRWLILISTSVVTGFAVSLSGPIGFVGLIVPHASRALLGVANRLTLVFCALLGGVFLMSCDYLSRLLSPPAGVPVGIVCSLFGVPFFIYLLSQKNYRFHA